MSNSTLVEKSPPGPHVSLPPHAVPGSPPANDHFTPNSILAEPRFGPICVDPAASLFRFCIPGDPGRTYELLLCAPGQDKSSAQAHLFTESVITPGMYGVIVPAREGDLYCIRVSDAATGKHIGTFPDPAAFTGEDGHRMDWALMKPLSWSVVNDPQAFSWPEAEFTFSPVRQQQMCVCEVDVGVATAEGTFAALTGRLDFLRSMGITTLLIMPIDESFGSQAEQFGMGYEPNIQGSVQGRLGGPAGWREFVAECHKRGMTVLRDLVFNHWSIEDNFVSALRSGLSCDEGSTPHWGWGPNLRDPLIVKFFADIASREVNENHVDGLRFDATHWLAHQIPLFRGDDPAQVNPDHPFVQLVAKITQAVRKEVILVAEHPGDFSVLVTPAERGGVGLSMVYNDAARHACLVAMTGERNGFYGEIFAEPPTAEIIAFGLKNGFCFGPGYPGALPIPPNPLDRIGSDGSGLAASVRLNWVNNHDWRGNARKYLKLGEIYGPDVARALTLYTVLRPGVPGVFLNDLMCEAGQQYGFTAFRDDPRKIADIEAGRRREQGTLLSGSDAEFWEPPSPCARATYEAMKLKWDRDLSPAEQAELVFTRMALHLRQQYPALIADDPNALEVAHYDDNIVVFRRDDPDGRSPSILTVMNLRGDARFAFSAADAGPWSGRHWEPLLDSAYLGEEQGVAPIAVLPNSAGGFDLRFQNSGVICFKSG